MRPANATGVVLGGALALLVAAIPCPAEDEPAAAAPAAASAKAWAVEVALPLWVPGNYGTIRADGRTARVDVDPVDMLELLFDGDALAGGATIDVRWERSFFFADGYGGYSEESASESLPIERFPRLGSLRFDATATIKLAIADFAGGYRVGEWTLPNRRRPFTLDVFAGARYQWFLARLRASASLRRLDRRRTLEASRTYDWADPVVGLRWSVPLLESVSVDMSGDVGGFGASSDFAWKLVGGVRWWLDARPFGAEPWIGAGYRAQDFERSDDANDLNLELRGPHVGAGLAF